MGILQRDFYERPTLDVAHDLIGKILVREIDDLRLSGIICEAEAYLGIDDTASHASKKKTPRNSVMFDPGGVAYVYFVYGLHYMFNIVTEPDETAGAVLIRAIYPQENIQEMIKRRNGNSKHIADGPAKLCQALDISKNLNGKDLTEKKDIWLEKGIIIPDSIVNKGPRIGIQYASEKDQQAPYRFWVDINKMQRIIRETDVDG